MARKYSDKNRDCKIFRKEKSPPPFGIGIGIEKLCMSCKEGDSPFGLPPALRMGKPKDFGVVLFTYK